MNSRRVVAVARWVLALGALTAIVLLYRNWLHVNSTTVALTLLLLILMLAAEWGLIYAVVISIVATLCYNFFFLPPVGRLTIADPQNWLTLFVFFATAVIASRLSERARDQTQKARLRQAELELLFRLSRELLQTENLATLVSSIPTMIASATDARAGLLYLLDGDRFYSAGPDRVSSIELPHLRHLANELTSAKCDLDEVQVPLKTGVRPRGLLLLRGVSLSLQTSAAIGGLVSIAMDRALALETVAHNEAAKESERLRTLMIDSITHEFRTPLTSIKGAATTLLTLEPTSDNSFELLTIIDEESDRMNRLLSEAVEMARLDARQVQMHFARVDLQALIRGALASCSSVEAEHELQIKVASDLAVSVDSNFVQKVICNLLENAAKYSGPGTPIIITADRSEDWISLAVADRGRGIDPFDQALLFERFPRVRPGTEEKAGSGMGLAISRSIIEAHGGTIDVVSQVGKGSVFTLKFPQA